MIEPVFEKGYPSYDAVNRVPMTDGDMVVKLHEIARQVGQYGASNLTESEMRQIADRFSELAKAASVAQAQTDRIEELEAELYAMTEDRNIISETSQQQFIHTVELEAQLAKAVEALGGMIGLFSVDNVLRKGTHLNMEISYARTTLAELTGGKDD